MVAAPKIKNEKGRSDRSERGILATRKPLFTFFAASAAIAAAYNTRQAFRFEHNCKGRD